MSSQRVTLPIAGYIIGALLVALGLGIAWLSPQNVPALLRQWQSSQWPTAPGTVVESDVQTLIDIDRNHTYQIHLHTSFVVGERDYYLYEPYPGLRHNEVHEYAPYTRLTRRFPKGANVQVHYDPADPSRATLVTGLQPRWWVVPMIALIPLLLGLWLLLYSLLETSRWIRQLINSGQR